MLCSAPLLLLCRSPPQYIYADSQRVKGGDQNVVEKRLIRAIQEIRSTRLFHDIPILLCVENAPGPIGPAAAYMLQQYQMRTGHSLGKILMMREYGTDRKPGVPKTKDSTEQMVRHSAAMMRFDRVHFSSEMRVGEGLTVQGMIDKALQQMSEYRCEVKYNKNDPHAEPKFKWTGRQDDMLIAMMMCMYWEAIFWSSNYGPYIAWQRTL